MNSPQTPDPKVQSVMIVSKMVWTGLTVSQGLYTFVLWKNLSVGQGVQSESPLPFAVIATVFAVVSLALFWIKLRADSIDKTLATAASPALGLGRVFVSYIICWALNEVVVLMGFVQSFVFVKTLDAYLPFLGAGLILNILMFPRARPNRVT